MTDIQSLYQEGTYLSNNPNWHAEDASWKVSNIIKMLSGQSLSLSSVCEVGCGSGEVLLQLSHQTKYVQYSGYEISPQAFEICRTKQHDSLSFFHADLTHDQSVYFDLLLVIDIFEHVEDYLGFLRSLKTKSKYQIFHIPLDMNVSSVLRKNPIIFARQQVGHLHYFSKDTALATLQDLGYEIVDSFYTCGSIELSPKTIKTQMMNLPRKFLYHLDPDFTVRVLGGFSLMVMTKTC
jgi:hypothetical protein